MQFTSSDILVTEIIHRKFIFTKSLLTNGIMTHLIQYYFVGGRFFEHLSYPKHFANLVDLNTPKALWYLKPQRNQNWVKKTCLLILKKWCEVISFNGKIKEEWAGQEG